MFYPHLYRSSESWPFRLIAKRADIPSHREIRQYKPRSDLIILQSNLPRLLVEVNSHPKKLWPENLIRLLVQGASVVRFANKFVEKFKRKKDFVLFAMYVWDNAKITRYALFQEPNKPAAVCWTLCMTKLAG
jgi:hypothetical protein